MLPDTPPPMPVQSDLKGKRKSKVEPQVLQEVQPQGPPQDKCEMDKFFAQSKQIKELLASVNVRLETLGNYYKKFLQATEVEQSKMEADIEKVLLLVNQASVDIKKILDELKSDNERIEKIADQGSGDIRMRTLHYASLVRQFSEAMKEFKKTQKMFSEKQQEQIKATYLIVRPYATMRELNKLFDATGEMIMTRSDILKLGEKGDLARHLAEVRARHENVISIEKGISALNQMFIDLEVMVDEQGDVLNSIEDSLENTEDYLDEAAINMQEARELKKAIRKKRCSIF
jgi:syntaxin 1B/2/3